MQLIVLGPLTVGSGNGPLRIAFRLDAVSATMALLVAFVGWVVMRYSRTYLDARRGRARSTRNSTARSSHDRL